MIDASKTGQRIARCVLGTLAGLLISGAVSILAQSWRPVQYGLAGAMVVVAVVLLIDSVRK